MRWPLASADESVAQQLRDYVAETSFPRFTGMQGLRFKTWRMREGEWFEGTYVFFTDESRAEFEATFRDGAATAPVTELVGSPPDLIEPFEVVALAEGWEGFEATPRG